MVRNIACRLLLTIRRSWTRSPSPWRSSVTQNRCKVADEGWRKSMAMELMGRIHFRDPALRRKYEGKKIPMNLLVESYLDEKIDIAGDLHELLRKRQALVNYRVTGEQVRFILSKFLPQ